MPTETAGNRAVKIILTGCTGTGKTTLGLHMQEKGYVQRYIHEDWKWPSYHADSDEARLKARKASIHWMNTRAELIQDNDLSFAMDRGPMDILHHWAIFKYAPPPAWSELGGKSSALLRKVDLIVFFPWQSRSDNSPPPSANEDGLIRDLGGYQDILIQSLLLGITHQLVPSSKILMLPRQASTETRANIILNRINELKMLASPSLVQD